MELLKDVRADGHVWIGPAQGLKVQPTIALKAGQGIDTVFHTVTDGSKIIANALVKPAVGQYIHQYDGNLHIDSETDEVNIINFSPSMALTVEFESRSIVASGIA